MYILVMVTGRCIDATNVAIEMLLIIQMPELCASEVWETLAGYGAATTFSGAKEAPPFQRLSGQNHDPHLSLQPQT